MSSSDRLEEEVRRGEQAAALVNHPLLAEAFDTLESELINEWLKAPVRDLDGQHTLKLSVNILGQVKQHIHSLIETGQLASIDLSRRGLSAPR